MTKENLFIEKNAVKVDDLEEGTVITAYTGFGKRYANITPEVRDFVQHNFPNCKLTVLREDRKLDIPTKELKAGDTIHKIYNFPPKLSKLTRVSTKLRKALNYRDIKAVDIRKKPSLSADSKRELKEIISLVEQSTKKLSAKEARRTENLNDTKELVRQVSENARMRNEAANAIKDIMENARRGKPNIGDISSYVDNITENSSAEAMSAITSLKASDQTYAHCIDVGVIFQTVYNLIIQQTNKKSAFSSMKQAILSAFLHDFGKSRVPKEILESTARFDRNSDEMKVMMTHPDEGARLLVQMDMTDTAVNMARFHHVKKDTSMLSSYPRDVPYENVAFETRLLSIIDTYQALVGKRNYKRSWSPPSTMRYIDALAGVEYDDEVWAQFLKIMGLYPKGSLVELNNHSIGFVVSVPRNGNDPKKPVVAVIRNEYGEDLTHHELLDLQEEMDVSILKDLDNHEVFGTKALDKFMAINVS